MNRILAIPLLIVLILTPIGPLVLGQQASAESAQVAKMKAEIIRRNTGDKSNVSIKLRNGAEITGRITQTSDNMFTLKENKTKYHRDLMYADVARVKGKGLSRGAKFGILTAIVTGAVVIGALINLKHLDPFEHGVLR